MVRRDSTHPELAALYPEAKPINSNPISTPAEIADRKQKTYEKQVKLLRQDAPKIGVYVAAPYVLGLFAIQYVVMRILDIAPGDIGGAMFIVFASFFVTTLTVFIAYYLFNRASDVFNSHYLKAWPIITTIFISMVGSTPLALRLMQPIPLELLGYLASLALIMLVTIVISTCLIYIWTSKLSPKKKIGILVGCALIFIMLLFI